MVNLKNLLEYILFRAAKMVLAILPRRLCLLKGRMLGRFFFYLDKSHRSLAISNLNSAIGGEISQQELKRIAKNSFLHFGQFLIDLIKLSSFREKRKLLSIEGEENIRKAIQAGKGALLLSAHYGNWEIAPFLISKIGKLNVIARSLDNNLLERELLKLRTSMGAKVIYKHLATRQVLRSLRANEMVAILIDQNVLQDEAVFVDFFGKKAGTTPSLATFFIRTGSPIIPIFCYPISSHKYHIKILEPIQIPLTGNHTHDVLKITQLCTKIIETQIRKNPSFWLWFHNRWRTQPRKETKT